MSLANLIGENILISHEKDLSVNSALHIACSMLIAQNKIEKRYLEAIKTKHKELGPYYVLAPKIAMPHARPEDGVNEACLQLTVFKNGANFESKENGDVYFSITLAAKDANSHIETIMALSTLFQHDEDVNSIINAKTKQEISEILQKY